MCDFSIPRRRSSTHQPHMQGVIVLALDVERPAQKSEYIRDSEQKPRAHLINRCRFGRVGCEKARQTTNLSPRSGRTILSILYTYCFDKCLAPNQIWYNWMGLEWHPCMQIGPVLHHSWAPAISCQVCGWLQIYHHLISIWRSCQMLMTLLSWQQLDSFRLHSRQISVILALTSAIS